MDLLEGKSLHEVFQQAPLAWRWMLEIVAKVATALAEANGPEVALGTLTPHGIFLVERADGTEHVDLLDLRIAAIVETGADGEDGEAEAPARDGDPGVAPGGPRTTAAQETVGERMMRGRIHRGSRATDHELGYLSPEQLMGKALDQRSDLFTLGVIAYEMITGLRPFPDAGGPAGVITAILKQTPPPMSKVMSPALAAGRPPPEVDELIQRCLARSPADRYPDGRALAYAAASVLARGPQSPPPAIPSKRTTLRGIVAAVGPRPTPPAARPAAAFTVPAPATPPYSPVRQVIDTRRCEDADCAALHRVLPGPANETVGRWMFLDHFGPMSLAPGDGWDSLPHPHAGLASVTYLFEGRIVHRDSLGNVQSLGPGGVNWLSTGRGVLHSERSGPTERRRGARLHGVQLWFALPMILEDGAPVLLHHDAGELPTLVTGGVRIRVVVGAGFGAQSPLQIPLRASLFDIRIPRGSKVRLELGPGPREERAVYVVAGAVDIDGAGVVAPRLGMLPLGRIVTVSAVGDAPAHILVLASPPNDEPSWWWWSFIGTSRDRLEAAKQRWRAGELGSIPGETEALPDPGT